MSSAKENECSQSINIYSVGWMRTRLLKLIVAIKEKNNWDEMWNWDVFYEHLLGFDTLSKGHNSL